MKTYPFINVGLTVFLSAITFGGSSLVAQDQVPISPAGTQEAVGIPADQLEDLVAPIALYPDALIALILPASTVSSDVVLAARFLKAGNTINAIDSQPWEDSVKGLAHYPDVVKWMDENLEWTQQMGEAYLAQPQAVMDAIQRARAIARSNGVLVDTPQQRVVLEDSYIRIIPAQRDVIYVPRYDPEIIYVQRPLYYYPDPWVTFGIGFGVGSWLSYDLDWRSHRIWVDHHRHHHWRHHHDWRHRPSPGRPGYVHNDHHWRPWAPPAHRHRAPHREWRHGRNEFARPAPLPGAPRFDRERWRGRERDRDDRIVGGRRPGVVLPDHQRDRGAQTNNDRRERWRNRERRDDDDNHSNRPRPGGFRRPESRSEVTTNVVGQPRAQMTPPTHVPPPVVSPRGDQPGIVQGRQLNRVGRPPADGRFGARRSVEQASSPNDPRWQRPQGVQAPRISGQREGRRAPSERTYDRQSRQPSVPQATHSQPPAVTARQAPIVTPAAPQMRSGPAREFRQPARIAQPSAPASAPAAVRHAPPVRSEARAEARASRGEHGQRSADNHGNRSSGRGSRGDRRAD